MAELQNMPKPDSPRSVPSIEDEYDPFVEEPVEDSFQLKAGWAATPKGSRWMHMKTGPEKTHTHTDKHAGRVGGYPKAVQMGSQGHRP